MTAIPERLRVLDDAGCIVTIAARGGQQEIAQTIRAEKADAVRRGKANQGILDQDLQDWFAAADHLQFAPMNATDHETRNMGHGRIEIRRCWAIADPVAFEYIRHYAGWADLRPLGRVERERHLNGTVERDVAYYICARPHEAARLLQATRAHGSVDNSVHWVRDVPFREAPSRIRLGYRPQNRAVLRHLALNLLKTDPSIARLRQQRYWAALDDSFLFS